MQTGNRPHAPWPATDAIGGRRSSVHAANPGIAAGYASGEDDELGLRGVPVAIALSLPIWAILITATLSVLTWIG